MTTLFLHMGPGMNAGVERQVLQNSYPNTVFWDQPIIQGENAFVELTNECIEKSKSLYQTFRKPIHLHAHSFGGMLALEMIKKCPEIYASLTLCATGSDPVFGYFQLLKRIVNSNETDPKIKSKAIEFFKTHSEPTLSTLWELIGMIAAEPDFMRLYWTEKNKFSKFKNLTANAPPIHFGAFHDILNSFLKNFDNIPKRISWDKPCTLILGDQDPLISVMDTSAFWKTSLPQIEINVRKNSGHFVHIEDFIK